MMFVLCCDVMSDLSVTRFNEKRKISLFSSATSLCFSLSRQFFFSCGGKGKGGQTIIEKKRTDQNKKELLLQHVNEKSFVLNFCLSLWVL
jgi:hypothetical protein